MTFCALLRLVLPVGQGVKVYTIAMSILLDKKCPQNATSVHKKFKVEKRGHHQ
jgi:hypothetical protein